MPTPRKPRSRRKTPRPTSPSRLSHGGHRYYRWLVAKANRERIAKLFASSVSEYDRLVPAPTSHDILVAAAAAVRVAVPAPPAP
jgi:hypothetical protein